MSDRPSWIPEQRWDALSPPERLVEQHANALLRGPSREFISANTLLIWDCLDKGVMAYEEIAHWPLARTWSLEQCKQWCKATGIDLAIKIDAMRRDELTLMLAEVIKFGDREIDDLTLRRIVRLLYEDNSEHGLAFWRSIVEAHEPTICEWWSIEPPLADDLIGLKECVLKNRFGHWWGRQATGQDILLDGILQNVARIRLKRGR